MPEKLFRISYPLSRPRRRTIYIEKKLKQLEDRKMRRNAHKGKPQDDGHEQATEQFRGGALKVGEKVRIKDNGMAGEVIRVSNKAVTVAIGNITSKMPLDRVRADLFQ